MIVLITGAGSGIGQATAKAFYDAGHTVIISGRNQIGLDQTLELINDSSNRCIAITCDISDPIQVTALFNQIENTLGRIDMVFNNAGATVPKLSIEDIPVEHWYSVINTNVVRTFLIAQAAVKLMKKQIPPGGRIINNGSIAAHSPRPNTTIYTTAKHAVAGLTKSLALDCRPYNIAVGQIDIGPTATEMVKSLNLPDATMDPEDVANTVLHMASLPLSSNVLNITLIPTTAPFVGRG
jgi:NAD(P)-dependent dehydrogenase (short-subunit alcohol dehydrogenase family)